MKKHRAAPAIELVQEMIAPCHQPKTAALAKVNKNAGNGAIKDWNIISKKDTNTAQTPKERIYPIIVSTLAELKIIKIWLILELTAGIAK